METHLNTRSREEIIEKIVVLQYEYIAMSLSPEIPEQSESDLMERLNKLYDELEHICRVKLFANIHRHGEN